MSCLLLLERVLGPKVDRLSIVDCMAHDTALNHNLIRAFAATNGLHLRRLRRLHQRISELNRADLR